LPAQCRDRQNTVIKGGVWIVPQAQRLYDRTDGGYRHSTDFKACKHDALCSTGLANDMRPMAAWPVVDQTQ